GWLRAVESVGGTGLGSMGSAFAANLADGGFPVVGCDIDPARTAPLAALGVTILDSPAEVGRRADVLVTSLPSVAALEAVVAGLETVDGRGRGLAEAGAVSGGAPQAAGAPPGAPGLAPLDA